ncbi:MAG: sulfotransferase domain-containing protein [Fimbriimonas sp.]
MRPNFFLAGAPKCGTTSLYDWLKDHPNTFLPEIKEPHFFALLRPDRVIEKLAEYNAQYAKANKPGVIAIGDGSTTYLHTPGALETVKGYAPDAKVVLSVRNPIDMVRSLHAYKLSRQAEDVEDFEAAWRLSFDRRQGKNLPKVAGIIDPYQIDYAEMGLLGKYVSKAYGLFPKENIHVVVFDDMVGDPRKTYLSLEAFLGLPDNGRTDFSASNVTSDTGTTKAVYKVAARLPRPVKQTLRKLGIGSLGVIDKLSVASAPAKAARPSASPEFIRELRDYYRTDVDLLGRLISRDLSHWLSPRA